MSATLLLAATLGALVAPPQRQEHPAFARELVLVGGSPVQELSELAGLHCAGFFAGTAVEAEAGRAPLDFPAAGEPVFLAPEKLLPSMNPVELEIAAAHIEPADSVLLAGGDALSWLALLEPRHHASALLRELERARSRGKRIFLAAGAASALAPSVIVPAATFGPIRRNPREGDDSHAFARGLDWLPFDLVEEDAPGRDGLARALWAMWTAEYARAVVLWGDVLLILDARLQYAEVRGPGVVLLIEGTGSRRGMNRWEGAHVSLLQHGDRMDFESKALRPTVAPPAIENSGGVPLTSTLDVRSMLDALHSQQELPSRLTLTWPDGSATMQVSTASAAGRSAAHGPTWVRARLNCVGAPPRPADE